MNLRGLARTLRNSLRRRVTPARWRSLDHVTPVSTVFGLDRGQAIDRYYIEQFLSAHREHVRGRVLEVGDDRYTRQFGSDVQQVDVLHATTGNPAATIVGDMSNANTLPAEQFDCVICVHTLQYVFDFAAALTNLHRSLRTGGVLLLAVPCTSQLSRRDADAWGEYWRFTSASVARLLATAFRGADSVTVSAYGNVTSCAGFLAGFAAEDLERAQLDVRQADYELVILAMARRLPA